ncbi:hypothetical protein AB3N59_03855 [Leptospira sp. WS92.C1]
MMVSKSENSGKKNDNEFISYSEWKQGGGGFRKGNTIQTWVQIEEDPERKYLLISSVVSSDSEKAILKIEEIQKKEKI